jgi:Na+-driven multidrug efflux pump
MSRETVAFQRKGLLRLSWPLLVLTVLTLLATLGNVVLLSQASPDLNAAVASANQLLGVTYDISVLFSLGALVVVSQLLGAGKHASARKAASTALRASTILGLAMALIILVGASPLLTAINTPPEIYTQARAYLWVVAFGLTFNAYIVAASAVLRAYGRTVALLVLGIVVNILDVVLLAVFLFVLELDAVGAALPTLLVRGVGVLILAYMVRKGTGATLFGRNRGTATDLPVADGGGSRTQEQLEQEKTHERSENRRMSWTMAKLSFPTVLENGTYNLVIVFGVSLINILGVDSVNARSYALTLTAIITGVILALSQANETIVGWDVGERSLGRALRQTLRTAAGTAVASAALAAVLWFFAEGALSIFGVNANVLEQARVALAISILLLPLSAVVAVVYGALRSTGDVVVPMAMSIASSVIVLLPLSYLFVSTLELGVAGIFWALVIAEAVKAVLLVARLISGAWRSIEPVSAEIGEDSVQVAAGAAVDENPAALPTDPTT